MYTFIYLDNRFPCSNAIEMNGMSSMHPMLPSSISLRASFGHVPHLPSWACLLRQLPVHALVSEHTPVKSGAVRERGSESPDWRRESRSNQTGSLRWGIICLSDLTCRYKCISLDGVAGSLSSLLSTSAE